jgi:hypothetical protein
MLLLLLRALLRLLRKPRLLLLLSTLTHPGKRLHISHIHQSSQCLNVVRVLL